MRKIIACLAIIFTMLCASKSADRIETCVRDTAVIQILDKITGHYSIQNIAVGTTFEFGSIKIEVHKAYTINPKHNTDNVAYIEIWSIREDEPTKNLFAGWIFSSNADISCIEDPTYDVWLVRCENSCA